jgi:hypothetical protein
MIDSIVEKIADMTADQLWELAKLLHRTSAVNANILKADLDFVDGLDK